ncbi:MAG: NAD-dependent epimerase/dehydratase family protein, partial [Balneolales bacterium]
MNTAEEVVKKDLGYIVRSLNSEFGKMAGKHVLITGGAGFLGYYLVRSLLNHNEYVPDHDAIRITVYDNYIRGVPDWLDSVRNDDHVILQEHDVTRPLPAHMADYQYIICAASIASPLYYRKYPLETMDANVNGLRHLLDYARRQKEKARPVDGFLFFSTSEIYGDPDKDHIPTPETYRGNVSSIGPRACYDESKRYGETLCVTFARQYGLPVTIARPFNNYGPGLKITDRR